MIIMLSAVSYRSFICSSGNVYVADQYGVIENVASVDDQDDLASAGCATLLANAPAELLGYKIGANFQTLTDQIIANLNNAYKYRIRRITVTNASTSLTTVQGGFYTGASKTGTTIVAAAQAYAALTAAAVALDLTLAAPNTVLAAATPLYLSLSVLQGGAATADVYIYGDAIPVS
jgi:hypothetical protein